MVRVSTVAGVPLATAVVAGTAVAGAMVVVGALVWGLWRWPRWEDRFFRSTPAVERYSQPWVPPYRAPDGAGGLGPEGHRAFAQALHAVTAAYLAECEREARR